MKRRSASPAALLLAALACGDDPTTPSPPDGNTELALEVVATGLTSPVYLTAPEGDPRLFIVEQGGRVRIVRDGQLLPAPWLDLASVVGAGGERGLLGLAFHPDFAANGRFVVHFTNRAGDTRVVRYTTSDPAADEADPVAADTLLSVQQPFANHNGGMLAFGPDGYLYVALGDGGSAGDPLGSGQDPGSVLGSILRLTEEGDPAPGNPFIGAAGDDRIWAWGLRNPWRFAFDPPTGMLYVADVGQNALEEVNAVDLSRVGVNYGWNVMEGTACFGGGGCDPSGLELPVYEYGHGEGCSITGGFVYRGSAAPSAVGRYFFADFCSAFVRSFRLVAGQVTDVLEHDLGSLASITSFGTDGAGELYLIERGGRVSRLVEAGG